MARTVGPAEETARPDDPILLRLRKSKGIIAFMHEAKTAPPPSPGPAIYLRLDRLNQLLEKRLGKNATGEQKAAYLGIKGYTWSRLTNPKLDHRVDEKTIAAVLAAFPRVRYEHLIEVRDHTDVEVEVAS
jgi:hypothetical protein